jgi:SAM-dependent methyltransferase
MGEARDQRWYEAAFGAHYPLLYQHRDAAEARRCLALLPRLAPLSGTPAAPILDLGCGDGRHLEYLQAAGHATVGVDLSPHLLAVAQRRRPGSGPLVRGDMRRLPFADGAFAAVLSLFTAFGYFGPPEQNGAPVREIARVLQPGGHWFLDYFDGDRVVAELGDGAARVRRRQVAGLQIRESRRYLPASRQVVKDVQVTAVPGREPEALAVGIGAQGLSYSEEVAVFTLAELDQMAALSDLERVAAAGDYDGNPLGEGPRWILVYRKTSGESS